MQTLGGEENSKNCKILVPCGEWVGEGKGRDVRGQLEECWGSIRVDLMLSLLTTINNNNF